MKTLTPPARPPHDRGHGDPRSRGAPQAFVPRPGDVRGLPGDDLRGMVPRGRYGRRGCLCLVLPRDHPGRLRGRRGAVGVAAPDDGVHAPKE
mgnify:CR=1 FL=1